MSRIRTIKPEFFRSRSLARCSRDARITFAGLWCEADSAGRGVADPRLLKGAIWPLDDEITADVIAEHLDELEREHIVLYEVDGEPYYECRNWEKHQAAAYRQGDPVHPARPDVQESAPCTTTHADPPDTVEGQSALKGKERKGKEGDAPCTNAPCTSDPPEPFDAFWSEYPRKVAREAADKAWRKLSATDRVAALTAIPAHRARWRREHPDTDQFVPHGSTWLTNRRWEDDLAATSNGDNGWTDPDTGAWRIT